MLPKDARVFQIFALALFLLLGVATRDWTLHPGLIATTIGTCLGVQWLLSGAIGSTGNALPGGDGGVQEQIRSLPSALITGLGLSLLLRADDYPTVMLAASAAIASKFFLRWNGKHIFNPGNFGIITALLLTPDAWVSPGQWGEEGWYALLFLGIGGLVLQRVGRWDTTVVFLGSYAVLEAIRNLWLGWTWDVWGHRLMSGSLLLFALFMVTDPRTIPDSRSGRLIWAGCIALLTFGLRNLLFLPTAVFWALFILAPLSPLLDWLLPAERFRWQAKTAVPNPVSTPSMP